ncbi:MAG TPA: hypothetical protein PKA19_14280 [Bacillota bacterium]|nr:hypothetical protein [Bacillota bacterium]
MMAHFKGKKKPKILLVTALILTLLVTYAVPLTVFADDTLPTGQRLEQQNTSADPGTTDPGTTDPGTTDPGTTDPGTTDPGTTDPGTTDPGTTDPGTTDPGTTDPGTTDPGTTDPGTTDPGTTDPGTTDPGTTDPGTTDPGTTDPGTTDPGTTDPGALDPGTVEPEGVQMLMALPKPGLSLEVTASVDPAYQGDEVTYTYKLQNTGNIDLSSVIITDRFPKEISRQVIWGDLFTTLKVGAKVEATYTYKISDGYDKSSLKNDAQVTGAYWGVVPVSGGASVTIQIKEKPDYDITFTKEASVASAEPGDVIQYTFTVENTGKKNLGSVILTDKLFGDDWSYDLGSLQKDKEVSWTTSYAISAEASGVLTNTAAATAFGKAVPKTWLAAVVQWINDEILELPQWLLNILGIGKDDMVKAEASATVTISSQEEPTTQVPVTFYVLKHGNPRPDTEGSQDENKYTERGILTITAPGVTVDKGRSLINEFTSSGNDKDAVEGKIVELSSQEAYEGLMSSINEEMNDAAYGAVLPTGWYIDWYDFKWEDDGWHVDGDIKVDQGQEPQDPETKYEYTVYYKVEGTEELIHTISGSTTAGSITIPEPADIDHSKYKFAAGSTTGAVTFDFANDEPSEGLYVKTVWYEPVGKEEDQIVGYYHIWYLVSGSGISIYDRDNTDCWAADDWDDETDASSVTVTGPALYEKYKKYVPVASEFVPEEEGPVYFMLKGIASGISDGPAFDKDGAVTINWDDPDPGYHQVIVWYDLEKSDEPDTPDNPINHGGRGNKHSSTPDTTITPEQVPAAPVEQESQKPADPVIMDDAAVPAGPLPKTGGLDALILYGLGALLAGGGTAIKLKNRKNGGEK